MYLKTGAETFKNGEAYCIILSLNLYNNNGKTCVGYSGNILGQTSIHK